MQALRDAIKKGKENDIMVKDTWTERYKRSAIPYMVKLFNEKDRKKQGILRQVKNFVPVNNGSVLVPYH